MMKTIENDPAAPALLDRRDERVHHDDSFGGSIQAFWDRIRSGDLGSLPVIVGLAIIWTVFRRSIRCFSPAATSSTCCSIARQSASSRWVSSAS